MNAFGSFVRKGLIKKINLIYSLGEREKASCKVSMAE
jgi:hypothetical protein